MCIRWRRGWASMASHIATGRPAKHGFTLIELLVVLAIVSLLLTLAVPRYFHSLERAKESVLRENLQITRSAIDKFYADTGRYPASLDELVEKRYLRSLPLDPILESASSWTFSQADTEQGSGIYDLHSTAPGSTSEGQAYTAF